MRDERLRLALRKLDGLAQHRVASVSQQAGVAAVVVVERAAARLEDRLRAALAASAFALLGLAFSLGVFVGRRS
jgi:hypothetical protein